MDTPTLPYGKISKFKSEIGGRELNIEVGKLAGLADGAVRVQYGDTVLLATAVVGKEVRDGIDFFPLTVDYEERMYAAGKISGSRFVKREGRPTEAAILTSRLIDRPIRPLFPKGFRNDVQVVVTVLSIDQENEPDTIAIIAASTALMLTGAPFEGPVGAAKIGLIGGKLVVNPKTSELEDTDLELVVAGTKDAVMMVEAGAKEVTEEKMLEALELAHKSFQDVVKMQEKIAKELGIKPVKYDLFGTDEELISKADKLLSGKLGKKIQLADTTDRRVVLAELADELKKALESEYTETEIMAAFEYVTKKDVRRAIVEDKLRPDGRGPADIRPIACEVGVLPRTHGSGLFTRGQTQALSIATLGPISAAQMLDTMEENDTQKRYMHHYNMPPYSTGEARPMRSAGRREIGHGALAERALAPVIPEVADFPYAIRVVSEILSSNGSTSMASVCGSTLSLMDAGVPIKTPISGIAMGLVTNDKGAYTILSDIQGAEDFAGDMDFKVAGSKDGITALQMDIKVTGISIQIMKDALAQAKVGRMHIMDKMLSAISKPREELSQYAPRIYKMQISPDKIKVVIGKGGETINKIIEDTGVSIDIEDTGLVMIASVDGEAADEAIKIIEGLTEDPEVGKVYNARITRIMDFGAFAEIMPGKEGLIHISQIADHRVERVTDELSEGQEVKAKLVEIDSQGRLNLSMKAAGK